MSYRYSAYGLTIDLPFPCPPLPEAGEGVPADITVREGAVARDLPHCVAGDSSWQAAPGVYLYRGGMRSARFLIENGTSITVQRNPGADSAILQFHFMHPVLAALLRQRGLLVLHANAAAVTNGAIAISGESGAGKSTTLAALVAKGCRLLSDDVTALQLSATGPLEVLPGVPHMHLCRDAAAGLGHEIDRMQFPDWRGKAALPAGRARAENAVALKAIYVLKKHSGSDIRVRLLTGVERFTALQASIYGPLLPEEHPAQFPAIAALHERVPIYVLERPAGRWSVEEVCESILRG